MAPSRILRDVYEEHIGNYGEPDESFVYEKAAPAPGFPGRIDVFVWNSDPECDVATFSTIGMSDKSMTGASHRAELHFAIRKCFSKAEMGPVTLFMANLAMHPFHTNSYFDWYHTIAEPGPIPQFKEAQCVWLHPPFVEDGWAEIRSQSTEIRILNIVPITEAERELQDIQQRADALDGIDIFAPR